MINLIRRIVKFLAFHFVLRVGYLKHFILRLKSKNGIIIKNIQGSRMYIDLKDMGISSEIALYGIREPESTKMIQKVVKDGDVVLEIGANRGYYALMESKLVGKNGKVYCIEPLPENVEHLKKNIELNGYNNMEVYQLAIGDKNGTASMSISSHSNLGSLMDKKDSRIVGSLKVKLVTLDNFLKEKRFPDFIRMDVEGYEYNIIKGMMNVLKSNKPLKMFIEVHPHIMNKGQTTFVLKSMMEHGFKTKKVTMSFTMPEMKVKSREDYDYSSKSIKELLSDESIISGSKGAFEIFFER